METLVTLYQSVPPFVWAFLFGTPFIVAVVNLSKKVFGVNSTLVIHSLTATTGFLVTAIPELLSHNPKPLIFNAAFTSAFFTFANFLYAASKKLQPFLASVQRYEDRKAAAKASTFDLATPASVGTATPTTVHIPVSDPTVFEG